MDMTYLSGRHFSSYTTGNKTEGGDWNVRVLMSETLVYPNGLERKEEISGTYTDANFHEAHKNAMRDVLQRLQDVVYSRGFDSLIEGLDYERSLVDDSTTETDEASSPE